MTSPTLPLRMRIILTRACNRRAGLLQMRMVLISAFRANTRMTVEEGIDVLSFSLPLRECSSHHDLIISAAHLAATASFVRRCILAVCATTINRCCFDHNLLILFRCTLADERQLTLKYEERTIATVTNLPLRMRGARQLYRRASLSMRLVAGKTVKRSDGDE